MQRFLLPWVVWLMLEASLLNAAVAFLPADPGPPQSPNTTPTFTQSCPDSSNSLFKGTSSVSQELGLQCARQSKQVFALVRACTLFLQVQERDGHLRSAPAPVFSPALFFFPRKLSPPSAEDEPFLHLC
jgi:hypothetical protein